MNPNFKNITANFVQYCVKELNIQQRPFIKLIADKNWVAEYRSFGEYNPNNKTIKVYYSGRNTADVLRSLAHELTHHRQEELGLIEQGSGQTGTDIENEANAMAGILLRDFGKQDIQIYDLDSPSLNEVIKINLYPGKKGVDVDFANKDIKDAPKVKIPLDKLLRNEPAEKMKTPESIETIKNLAAAYKKGKKIDPILVRKKGDKFQILDGHHRFTAAKLAGLENINAIIVPEENITPVDNDGNVLNEGKQVGTLYHFTTYDSAIGIVTKDFKLKVALTPDIKDKEKLPDYARFVSFTRNRDLNSPTISREVRFTIDGNALSNKYRTEPFADVKAGFGRQKPGEKDEAEERVNIEKHNGVVDIKPFLISVDVMEPKNMRVDSLDSEAFFELVQDLKERNIPYKTVSRYR